jgi:hypothetical protein
MNNNKNYDYEYVLNDDPFKPTNGRYVYKNNSNSKLSENTRPTNNYTEINRNIQIIQKLIMRTKII